MRFSEPELLNGFQPLVCELQNGTFNFSSEIGVTRSISRCDGCLMSSGDRSSISIPYCFGIGSLPVLGPRVIKVVSGRSCDRPELSSEEITLNVVADIVAGELV